MAIGWTLYHLDLLMKYLMDSVEKNEVGLNEMMNLSLIKMTSIEFNEEYRSPGWDRYKKNKLIKWKK